MKSANGSPYVFVACDHAERDKAADFTKRLREAGILHFLHVDTTPWREEEPRPTHEALERATHLVVFMSPAKDSSGRLAYEIGFARGRNISLVIYLVPAEAQPPPFLASEPSVRSPEDERSFIEQLRTQVRLGQQKTALQGARGMWKDRDDLPDFQRLREELDRY